ncbi:MAG: superoxide dismutase family protein [Pseudomonadota bacterium]
MATDYRDLTFAALMLAVLTACGPGDPAPPPSVTSAVVSAEEETRVAVIKRLHATMTGLNGSDIEGVVVMTADGDQLILAAALDNVAPGAHAVHVHERGDCSASDGSSAGPHYSPEGFAHGAADRPGDLRHAGDFGNFMATDFRQGKFSIAVTTDRAVSDYNGRAVIVHRDPDRGEPAATEAPGDRIACGILAPSAG